MVAANHKAGVFGSIAHTSKSFKQLLAEKKPDYEMTGRYLGYAVETKFTHVCGLEFTARPEYMGRKNGKRCPCLLVKASKSDEQSTRLKLDRGDYDWELDKFSKSDREHTWRNKLCGHTVKMPSSKVIGHPWNDGKGCVCPECFGANGHETPVADLELAVSRHSGCTLVKTKRYKSLVAWIKHSECGQTTKYMDLITAMKAFSRIHPCRFCRSGKASLKPFRKGSVTKWCQGVEDLALDWITSSGKAKLKDVVMHSEADRLTIPYAFEGKTKKYIPDIWIPSQNRVVEVKDVASLGFGSGFFGYPEVLEMNRAKARAVVATGANFNLLVFDRLSGERVRLPVDWYDLPRRNLLKAIKAQFDTRTRYHC